MWITKDLFVDNVHKFKKYDKKAVCYVHKNVGNRDNVVYNYLSLFPSKYRRC